MVRVKRYVILLALIIQVGLLSAQRGNALYYVQFNTGQIDSSQIQRITYISDFNPTGYNNQPSFANEHTVLISSDVKGDTQGMDIVEIDLRRNTYSLLTETVDSEFSPIIKDGKLYYVRLTTDKKQYLWEVSRQDDDNGKAITANEMVGYFTPVGNDRWATFTAAGDLDLDIYHATNGEKTYLGNSIGRSLKFDGKKYLYYIHKYSDTHWYIKRYDLITKQSEIVKKTLAKSEDFFITPDNMIFLSSGSKVYKLDVDGDKTWTVALDFTKDGLQRISRMAYHPSGKLILVTSPK